MFDNYLFRPSQLDALMTKRKTKDEELSETCKSVLKEIFIKEFYGREKIVVSKYLQKGNEKENDSISLYRQFKQEFMVKNEKKLSNKFISGTPDIILEDEVVDIKTCWDIFTFLSKDSNEATKTYKWQLVAYMILAGKKKATLCYCLTDNDEYTVYSEVKKIQFALGLDDINDQQKLTEIEKQIRKNNFYQDIPIKNRIKEFTFELEKEAEKEIKEKAQIWRHYLNHLHSQYV